MRKVFFLVLSIVLVLSLAFGAQAASLKITTQPQDCSAAVGSTVKFTVAASGDNLTYQWQYRSPGTSSWYNSGMTGAKTATLSVPVTDTRNGQQYRCKVSSGSSSVTSSAATLTVVSVPTIKSQPKAVSAEDGDTAKFTVIASGAGLSYQWQFLSAGTTTWYNSSMSGAKTPTLTVPVTSARNGQQYRCKVTNAAGSVISSAAKLTVISQPTITTQPKSVAMSAGETAKFTVAAKGGALSYQWQFKAAGTSTWYNSGAAGAKTASITVEVTDARNGQQYRCVVTNSAGTVTSSAAKLSVLSYPEITTQPKSVSKSDGETAKFTVGAKGGSLTYQWQYKVAGTTKWYNSGMDGAKTATLSVPATTARNGQQYRCVVSNDLGSVTTNAVSLTVTGAKLTITTQPKGVTVAEGGTAKFTVAASGSGLTYQWQYKSSGGTTWKDSGMTGAKTATLSVQGTAARNGQQYRCVVKDNAGNTVTSNAATMTVTSAAPSNCEHHLEKIAAKNPTATKTGRIACWHCTVCDKYFYDQNAEYEVDYADTVIPATTDYIVYHIADEGSYLSQYYIDNTQNPIAYDSSKTTRLYSLDAKKYGYSFVGWFDLPQNDASSQYAEIQKNIPAGTSGRVELYAWWIADSYTITFKSNLIPVNSETYTVEQKHVLPTPKLDGYIFAGWSDDNGNIVTSIPVGTTGHKTYTANWLSERNQAWAKKDIGDPIIYEDESTNTILFAYEIGEIRNVPLYVIKDFGKINQDGVAQTVSETFSKTISQSEMQKYTNTVQKATTNTYAWTLSNEWTDSVSVNETWAQEHGMSASEAESHTKNETDNYYVSNCKSGSNTTVTINTTDTYGLDTTTSNTKTFDTTNETSGDTFSAEVDLEVGYGPAKLKGSMGREITDETLTKTGTETDDGGNTQTGTISHSGTNVTNESSWNNESGYSKSSAVSQSQTVTKALSQKIAESKSYGNNYINKDSWGSTQGMTAANSASDEYSSSVTFSIEEGEETTVRYETANTKSGYHRVVMAGTAHVYAVVGYDIESSSYFTYSFTVMDDEMHRFEDYSYLTAAYDDNQSSVLPFEVPIGIDQYVANRVCESDGLVVSKSGVVTEYNGTDQFVIIPEYKVVDNHDGSGNSVIKITGISATAFQGNSNIIGVVVSDHVSTIPANAFKNCTALETISAQGVTRIGENAFSGCAALKELTIGDNIVELGENAVSGLDKFTVTAANSSVVQAAVNSGAREITVGISDKCDSLDGMTLNVPASTERFAFNGYGKSFNNLRIVSDAQKTVINRAGFDSNGKPPLQFSSPEVELNEVTVQNSGIAAILSAPNTNLALRGTNDLTSSSEKTLLCRDVALSQIDPKYATELIVNGKLLIHGSVSDPGGLLQVRGSIVPLDEAVFNKYLEGMFTVTFNANGGTTDTTSAELFFDEAIGTLPEAVRTGYSFDGWFTKASGGEQITAETVFDGADDVTVYAHWTVLEYTANWNTGTGFAISVNRSSSPYKNAETGIITNGAKVYYGDILSVSYSAETGYTLGSTGVKSITVTRDITPSDIYASATANNYTYNIVCKSASGTQLQTSTVTKAFGATYTIAAPAITGYVTPASQSVTWDSTSAKTITFTYTPNNYSYNVVYRSSNGTYLNSSTVTKPYGTTNTISPYAITGYNTPAAQNVTWDSTSAKTITFIYVPTAVNASQHVYNNTWWYKNSTTYIMANAYVEIGARRADSVDVRIVWTNTLNDGYYGYAQWFNAIVGGVSFGDWQIATTNNFAYGGSGVRSASVTTGWFSVPASATSTSIYAYGSWWDQNKLSGGWECTFQIPAY